MQIHGNNVITVAIPRILIVFIAVQFEKERDYFSFHTCNNNQPALNVGHKTINIIFTNIN